MSDRLPVHCPHRLCQALLLCHRVLPGYLERKPLWCGPAVAGHSCPAWDDLQGPHTPTPPLWFLPHVDLKRGPHLNGDYSLFWKAAVLKHCPFSYLRVVNPLKCNLCQMNRPLQFACFLGALVFHFPSCGLLQSWGVGIQLSIHSSLLMVHCLGCFKILYL